MRIQDFLRPHLEGVSGILEIHAGSLNLGAYLEHLGVAYERRQPGNPDVAAARPGPGILAVSLFGPDAARHGPEAQAFELIQALAPGQRCAVLLGFATASLPLPALLDELSRARAQLIQLSSLEHRHLHGAALITGVAESIAVPRDPFGQALGPSGAWDDMQLRLANEYVALDFTGRHMRARLFRSGGRSAADPDHETPAIPGDADKQVRGSGDLERALAAADLARAEAQRARSEAAHARADARVAREETALAHRVAAAARSAEARARADEGRARRQLARFRASTSFAIARVLVETAKRPATLPRAPFELLRLWRLHAKRTTSQAAAAGSSDVTTPASPGRVSAAPALTTTSAPRPASTTSTSPAVTAGAPPRAAHLDNIERFVAHTSFMVGPRIRPVVAGILTDRTARALAFEANVSELGPNNARLIVERTDPDLLLVETAALAPGRPWAFAGHPAAVERTRLLLELVDQVHRRGRHAVLVTHRYAAASSWFVPLEPRFDLVLEAEANPATEEGWTAGVQLALFNPIAAPTTRDPRPLFLGEVEHRDPVPLRRLTIRAHEALRGQDFGLRLVSAAAESGTPSTRLHNGSRAVRWPDTPDLFRAHLVAVANPFAVSDRVRAITPGTLEQLACGMRILSGPSKALLAELGEHVAFAQEPDLASELVASLIAAGPRGAAEEMRLLRTLFVRHATPVLLSALARRLPGVPDPRLGRTIAAVVRVHGRMNPEAVVDSIVRQSHRPAEVLLVLEDDTSWPTGAQATLEATGIEVRAFKEFGGLAPWAALAATATSEWLTSWRVAQPPSESYLLDLALGGEMSRADVVAHQPGEVMGFVPTLSFNSGLVRRSVVGTLGLGGIADDVPVDGLEHRGLRLFALPSDPAGRM